MLPRPLDLIYGLILIVASPWLIWQSWRRGKYRQGWAEKLLGHAPRCPAGRERIWLHAVSVGEVLLLRPLIAQIRRDRSDLDLVISTTSQTGYQVARQTYPDLTVFYAPLDLSWAVRQAVRRVCPTVLALVELELWPHLIAEVKGQGGRVAVINGRLSHKSHRGYRAIRGPLGPTLRRLDTVTAQDQAYASRFIDLGVPAGRVSITGSIKDDGLVQDRNNARTRELAADLGLDRQAEILFVAGSTMAGEEQAAWQAYDRARRMPGGDRLRLILVPRHPERFDSVAAWILDRGEGLVRRSSTTRERPTVAPVGGSGKRAPVVLVDTVGELSAIWGLAQIAFVGGSLFPGRGGQNMMEPAAYGADVWFGPYTSNFRSAVERLLIEDAALRIADEDDLTDRLCDAIATPEPGRRRGLRARQVAFGQQGATGRTWQAMQRLLG